jgi:hypothetical protein
VFWVGGSATIGLSILFIYIAILNYPHQAVDSPQLAVVRATIGTIVEWAQHCGHCGLRVTVVVWVLVGEEVAELTHVELTVEHRLHALSIDGR